MRTGNQVRLPLEQLRFLFRVCDLLKCTSSSYSHDFLSSLQSCFFFPTIDHLPTRALSISATLIESIVISNPDQVVASGNIISDVSDHFSQFCILKSIRDKIKIKKSRKCGTFLDFLGTVLTQISLMCTGIHS